MQKGRKLHVMEAALNQRPTFTIRALSFIKPLRYARAKHHSTKFFYLLILYAFL